MHIDPDRWVDEYEAGRTPMEPTSRLGLCDVLRGMMSLSVRERQQAVQRLVVAALHHAVIGGRANDAASLTLCIVRAATNDLHDIALEVEAVCAKGIHVEHPAEVADYLCDYPLVRPELQAAVATALEYIDDQTQLFLEVKPEYDDCVDTLTLTVWRWVRDGECPAELDAVVARISENCDRPRWDASGFAGDLWVTSDWHPRPEA